MNRDFKIEDDVLVKYNGDDETVIIPAGVVEIGDYAFESCNSVKSIEFPNTLEKIGEGAFFRCKSLESVEIPYGVTEICEDAFYSCESLVTVEIPNSVREIQNGAFASCKSLLSIELPDCLEKIGESTFRDCEILESITIPENVSEIGNGAFSSCESLELIEVDESNTDFCSVDGVLYDFMEETLFAYPSGKSESYFVVPESVTTIKKQAFSGSSKLKKIILSDNIEEVEPEAFIGCKRLESIEFSALNIGFDSIDGVLYSNSIDNTLIAYPTGKKSDVFEIPKSVTGIGEAACACCPSITSVVIPNGVEEIGNKAFSFCEALESVEIPSSVTKIGKRAFAYCENLQTIIFHGTESQWERIEKGQNWDKETPADTVQFVKASKTSPKSSAKDLSYDSDADETEERLAKLKRLYDKDLISEEDFERKKNEILDEI